jgi:hypothetical protein
MVDMIKSTQAICPILFIFTSFDLKYFVPGHLVIKRKRTIGRIILSKYINICVPTDVESGFSFTFVPQFGQK